MSFHGSHVHTFEGRLYFGSVHGLHHFHCYINFFSFGSHEINGYFYLMGLRWGMRKRNAKRQKYKQVPVLFSSLILVLSLIIKTILERNGEVETREQKAVDLLLLLAVFSYSTFICYLVAVFGFAFV